MTERILTDVGRKLGIVSLSVLRKALELYQLMDVRIDSTTMAALKLTGSCKVIMCLELAATGCGHPFDRVQAVKFSGMNKKMYINSLKATESMLDLQQKLSIKDMAVQFGCTGAINLAQQALNRYESEYDCLSQTDIDFSTTLFQAAALCAACRKLKLRVDKCKLQDLCSVKKSTFDRLVIDLEKHADKLLGDKRIVTQKRPRTFLEEIEQKAQEEFEQSKQAKTEQEAEKTVNFEEWKRKILDSATKGEKAS
ncbi:hypothetical protein ScPMuIL_000228 [Solemya velum]